MDTVLADTESVPHESYIPSDRACFSSQKEVTQAWLGGLFPTHNTSRGGTAILYSSDNFKAIQYPDGSGELKHYRTREAIRTRSGLVINNSQCWSGGFAHCSPPSRSERDATLPLSLVDEQLETGDNARDIDEVLSEGNFKAAFIDGSNYAVGIGKDPTIQEYDKRKFSVRLEPYEAKAVRHSGPETTIRNVLTPKQVRNFPMRVVPSNEYRKTRLSEDEIVAHKQAGGKIADVQTGWSQSRQNRQYYRADLRGDVIVRQGKKFYIPAPGFDGEGESANLGLGYYQPQEAVKIEDDEFYARGRVGHKYRKYHMIDLGDTWHQVVAQRRDITTQ